MAADPKPDAMGRTRIEALEQLRGGDYPRFLPGEVWLVGAGPGDPGLLTLDALAALFQADVVVYDALIDDRVLQLTRAGAERHFVGKRGGQPSASQTAITSLLIEAAGRGRRVLRLKGGDPFLFGRGGEEMLALAEAGIAYRIVPGVTSGLAALAVAGIPATVRGVNRAIVLATGHATTETDTHTWIEMARLGAPIVFYMAMRSLRCIVDSLIAGGLPQTTPAAVIASATLAQQKVVVSTLAQLVDASRGVETPAIVVIGEVVRVRSELLALASAVGEEHLGSVPALESSCGG
jgi:uroporphyrin-III C-methyltransferase